RAQPTSPTRRSSDLFSFCPGSTNIDCKASTNVTNTGDATASDDCSAPVTITHSDTVTAGNCAGNYTITRRFTATDACGNSNTNCVQTITVTDTTPPTFTFCPGSTNIDCKASTNVTNTGDATASDDCSAPVKIGRASCRKR